MVNIYSKKQLQIIEPISYFIDNDKKTITIDTYKKVDDNKAETRGCFNIHVNPKDFDNINRPSTFDIKKKWFINLSTLNIPDDVVSILQLGENFSLSNANKRNLLEIIKDVKINLRHFDVKSPDTFRSHFIPTLTNHLISTPKICNLDKELFLRLKKVKSFCADHPDILFTRADKGNVTVAIEKSTYITKINEMLSDSLIYSIIKKNPINNIENSLNNLLKNWSQKDYIHNFTYKSLFSSDGFLPRAYGLPKIHKPGNSYRLIVSYIGSSLHSFAVFLHNILYKSFQKADSHIENNYDFVNKINNIELQRGHVLLSLDVVSLFTNVPIDLALKSIKTRWKFIRNNTKIPLNEFLKAIEFVLSSTFFSFDGKIYKQTFGVPMGSPLSLIISDIVMQDLEKSI